MIKSMTGYGLGEYSNELYKFKVEIKSVNHRYNNISIKMPYHLNYLEEEIKNKIKEVIHRGSIDVYINLQYLEESKVDVKIDLPLAKAYKDAFEEVNNYLMLGKEIELMDIINMPEVMSTENQKVDDSLIRDSLFKSLEIALDEIIDMRCLEGKKLKKDIDLKLEIMEEKLKNIETREPNVIEEYKIRLENKINDLLSDEIELDTDRFYNEIAYIIDKSSIDEEIVRLYSHLSQFRSILNNEEIVGRKLDFLVQEMNREINTIGSKSNDVKISKNVIILKSELEKIREQIQNIE